MRGQPLNMENEPFQPAGCTPPCPENRPGNAGEPYIEPNNKDGDENNGNFIS